MSGVIGNEMSIIRVIYYNYDMNDLSLGIYRHYKGNEYDVLCIAKHTETLEPLVVYRALYGDQDVWVRPLAMFKENVEVEGKNIPRFELIEANSAAH